MKYLSNFLLFIYISCFFSCVSDQKLKNGIYRTEEEVRKVLFETEKEESTKEGKEKETVFVEKKVVEYQEKLVEVPIQEFVIDNIGVEARTMRDKSSLLKKNNNESTIGLSKGNFNHAEIIYNYRKGIIYPIHTATQRVSVVELEDGEQLISYLTGDSLNWVLNNEVINNKVQIYIMPLKEDIATNFIVNTNKRKYIINLIENCNYMPVVRWEYGLDLNKQPILSVKKGVPSQEEEATKTEDKESSYVRQNDLVMLDRLKDLNFDYKVSFRSHRNYKPKWYPGSIFDDGFRIYIHIPNLDQTPIRPVIFATEEKKKQYKIVNYHVVGKYYIVDSIENKLILTTEADNKFENVYIERK